MHMKVRGAFGYDARIPCKILVLESVVCHVIVSDEPARVYRYWRLSQPTIAYKLSRSLEVAEERSSLCKKRTRAVQGSENSKAKSAVPTQQASSLLPPSRARHRGVGRL